MTLLSIVRFIWLASYFRSHRLHYHLMHRTLMLIAISLLCYYSSVELVESEVSLDTLAEGSIEIYVRVALAIALAFMTFTVTKFVFNHNPAPFCVYGPPLLVGILVSIVNLDTYKHVGTSLIIGYLRTTGLERAYLIVEGAFMYTQIGRSMCSRVNLKKKQS